jgi:hypothetical protein
MTQIDKEEVISALSLKPFGNQGWFSNKDECPFCGKKGKWGVIFTEEKSGIFHCWKCANKTSLYNYLKAIGRLDLAQVKYESSLESKLVPLVYEKNYDYALVLPEEVSLPLRLKPLQKDEYLDGRGFLEFHYKEFEPSYTKSALEKRLNNYIIFKIKQEGKVVAWLARSRYSKEWHKQNLEDYKNGVGELALRYRNSENDFTKFVGGYDLIPAGCRTVILVEGIFDKVNIDRILHLDVDKSLACCFTFGNSVSNVQMRWLKEKGIENVILMYDYGTVKESKSNGLHLSKYFNTEIAFIPDEGIDPGNMTLEYFDKVMQDLKTPIEFYTDRL